MTGVLPEIAAAQFLRRIAPGCRVMVALSGGGDSVGLLVALHHALKAMGATNSNHEVSLCAATVDHRLRPEAADEAAAMAELCAALGIAHRIMAWEEDKPDTGLSEAARAARYRLLGDAADGFDAGLIVTGHTLDDQLETVEMRRSRTSAGEGRGLAGMAEATLFGGRHWVARPFLTVWRSEIRNYLIGRKIGWHEDPSNENLAYERVRTRKAGNFSATAQSISAQARRRAALADAAANILAAHCAMPLPLLFRLDCGDGLCDEASRLAVAFLIACAGGRAFLPSQRALERLWATLKGNLPFRLSMARTVIERRGDVLYICRDLRDLPEVSCLLPGKVHLWDNRFLIEVGENGLCDPLWRDQSVDISRLPGRVAARAVKSLPPAPHRIQRIFLAPFDVVFPSFELKMAAIIMQLSGRKPLPVKPFI
jgi:tRNA(Ile)-lysidine synthase